MPNKKRIVIPGEPHHITQRGNYRQQVFFRNSDRTTYLDLLTEFTRQHGVTIHAYCLMPNHVHIIATPHDSNGLARAFERIHSDYARALHVRLRRTGHLWQGRFRSTVMDQEHFWAAMIYVEQNPVRAHLSTTSWDYRWSSAQPRLQGRDQGLLDLASWRSKFTPDAWRERLTLGLNDAALLDRIRLATRTGRPLGGEAFLDRLESEFGISAKPKTGGRPRKPAVSAGSTSSDILTKTAG